MVTVVGLHLTVIYTLVFQTALVLINTHGRVSQANSSVLNNLFGIVVA